MATVQENSAKIKEEIHKWFCNDLIDSGKKKVRHPNETEEEREARRAERRRRREEKVKTESEKSTGEAINSPSQIKVS